MKKVNVSTKKIDQFAGKWVAIDEINDKIIAVSDTFSGIEPLVTTKISDRIPDEKIPMAFKVPYKDEGPYIL
jgi:hypothetical protein